MTQVADSTHSVNTLYDAEGNRVRKMVAGGETRVYVHDAFGVMAAEYSTVPQSAAPPCRTCYLTYDYLGSVRMVTDQNGTVVARHDYLPYGEEVPANTTTGRAVADMFGTADGVSARFTGQDRDTETATPVDYFNARMFAAALGTFTRPDPGNAGADLGNPQSWNGYGYVGGNPWAFTDPSGLDCEDTKNGTGSCVPLSVFRVIGTCGLACFAPIPDLNALWDGFYSLSFGGRLMKHP